MKKILNFINRNRKTIFAIAAIVVPIALFGSLYINASAFGDYNDYDYDYSFDSGDSFSFDSGSDSYSGGGDDSGLGWVIFGLFRFVYDVFGLPGVCCLLVVFAIIGIVVTITKNKKKKNINNINNYNEIPKTSTTNNNTNRSNNMNNNQYMKRTPKAPDAPKPNRTGEIVEIIKSEDELFTEPDFITYAKQVYMDIQHAWCERDLLPVQAVLHSNLYERTKAQLDMKIRDKVVPHLERLTVEDAYMTAYRQDKEYEYVVVYLASKMIDYQTNEETGAVIYGDKESRWEMHYLMTFMRSRKVKTPQMGAASRAFNCPNCGGAMGESSTFGVCHFCGSSVKSGEYGWVLSDFNQAKNSTPDIGIVVEEKPEDKTDKIKDTIEHIQGDNNDGQ